MKELIKISGSKMKYFIIAILFLGVNCKIYSQSQNLNSNQATLNDNEIVANFMKPLNVVIPDKWINFAADAIKLLDEEGVASAHMILQEDLPKVALEDKLAYVLMAFDAIRTAYDKEKHTIASDEFFAEYLNYENGIKSVTSRFATDGEKRSEIIIALIKQETALIKQETAQIKQETAQNNKTSEELMLKTYKLNPNSEKLKILAKETKKNWDKLGYKYSEETAKMFKSLGIE